MGTARNTSAASSDTSSCRTWACWPGSASCCSSPSSRTKSFSNLAFSRGEWGAGKWKRRELDVSVLFLAFTCFVCNVTAQSCMQCESRSCLHSKQAAVAYAYLMTLPVMFTLCSSITSPLSVPICPLTVKQNKVEWKKSEAVPESLLCSEAINSIFKK